MTRSHAFSRALRQPHVITSSFDWFNVLSVSYVIGQSNYFGFGFTTLKRKPLYPPEYLRDLFRLRDNIKNMRAQCSLDFLEVNKLQVPKPNTTRYGKNSVKYLTAITWNKISDILRCLSTLSAKVLANSI